ncbi:Transcriptional regulator GlxA family, contains an amidase domain and an AraC-type DNA-binding HTH domain [Paenibacillus sp. ov031]|uniref:DJ-1/PfpI family protein n=1 Tax=Paenibacillus sp. ov031 TaxID=1761879 RepID=UPI00091FB165|nr:DJ-1/PfpI family protein [Paenibacillus sp. ov031]SHN58112.1 Transcriptional regulator GlxA family, contains an amidase domain and an AraC-type DNA-binding HTH domain [Paenibacillus sp. ov031]
MLTVQIVLFDGFDLLDAVAPYEVFCAASMHTDNDVRVEMVTAEGPRPVTSGMNGLTIEANNTLDPERGGIILVPGAAGNVEGDGPDSIPAILGKAMNTELTTMIKTALEHKDILVATVCGGSLLLAMGGLLEGRSAVTHRLGMDLLGATGAIPVPARVVDDGNLVTGGGVTSGLDVALYLVERELGPRIAHEIEQLFEYERRGTVWRAKGIAPTTHKSLTDNEPNIVMNQTVVTSVILLNEKTQTTVFDGNWDTTIATPVGKLEVKLYIKTISDVIQGTATQGNETIPFLNPVLCDNKLTWSLSITKPMRLNLKFEVAVDGDKMNGIAKAGLLPASKLTGKRIN